MKFIKITGAVLTIVILFAIIWPLRVYFYETKGAEKYTSYLKENYQHVNLETNAIEFNFPDAFYENQLFILGENHGSQHLQKLDLALIKHLNEKIGLQWIYAEVNPYQALMFNRYLESGNEAYITPIFSNWYENTRQWGNQQFFEKIKLLREHNLTLPEDQRVAFFGVDAMNEFSVRKTEALLAQEVLTDSQKQLLSNNLKYIENDASRYEIILNNTQQMVELGIGDNEPLYGLWGLFHAMKTTIAGGKGRPLAMQLTESDLPFADKTVTLISVFVDSENNTPSRILPSIITSDKPFTDFPIGQDNPYLFYIVGVNDLKSVADGRDVTIFDISKEDSPYAGSRRMRDQYGLLSVLFEFPIDSSSGSAADYLVLIQNSPAVDGFK